MLYVYLSCTNSTVSDHNYNYCKIIIKIHKIERDKISAVFPEDYWQIEIFKDNTKTQIYKLSATLWVFQASS